jgi:hypothetical protein
MRPSPGGRSRAPPSSSRPRRSPCCGVEWAVGDTAARARRREPLLVGLIAAALAAGAIVLVIVKVITRKAPPSG